MGRSFDPDPPGAGRAPRGAGRLLLPAFLASSVLAGADVLVLSGGRKLSGDVREKKDTLTIQVEGQELVFGRDEVAKWCKSPADLIGEEAKKVEAAKAIYQEALPIQDLNAQGVKMKEALVLANKAREAYAEARALFPEDRYGDLDQALVKISQLMRLIRERIGTGIVVAARPATPPPAAKREPEPAAGPAKPAETALARAFAVLADPARRGDAAARREAAETFAAEAKAAGALGDLAAAARLFLARESDILPDVASALQDHLTKRALAAAAAFTPEQHLAAAKALAEPVKALAGKGAEPILLFAAGHLGVLFRAAAAAGARSEAEACAGDLGFRKSEVGEAWGTPEGLAACECRGWAAAGMYDLGIAQFHKEYAASRDYGVQYLLAWMQLQDAFAKKLNYRKALAAWVALAGTGTPAQKAHAAAVAEALRKRLPCAACGGTHRVRCPLCRGKKKLTLMCNSCEGSGKVMTLRGTFRCPSCGGQGYFRDVDCTKCKMTGEVECKAAWCRQPVEPPTFEELFDAAPCAACGGTGLATRRIAMRCPSCFGLGEKLVPKGEPGKTLE